MNAVKTDQRLRKFFARRAAKMNGEPESTNESRKSKDVQGQGQSHEVTQLLTAWRQGDQAALQRLTPVVYEELRRLAHRYMEGQSPHHTLQTTALVHEAYLRLVDQNSPSFTDRSHFFAVAAKAMRQILVDHARTIQRQKRGAGASRVKLDETALISPEQSEAIVDLNDALERLASLDSRAAQGVELRYFGGLNQDEIADVLKVSAVTVRRDWVFARAWLYTELQNVA
jgi:RNA polymerase sigma factor (TIGR02999 family)